MMTIITSSGTRYVLSEAKGYLPWADGVSPVVDMNVLRVDDFPDTPSGVYEDAVIYSPIEVGEKVRFKCGDETWVTSRVVCFS